MASAAWIGVLVSGFGLAAMAGVTPGLNAPDKDPRRADVETSARRIRPAYATPAKPVQFLPRPGPLDDAIPEVARTLIERKNAMMLEPSSGPAVEMSGCLQCHVNLDGITVRTFVRHIQDRYDPGCAMTDGVFAPGLVALDAWAGSPGGGSVPEQSMRTPEEELGRSLAADGGRTRVAGSMRQELRREKAMAEMRERGWTDGKPPPPKPAMDRARELLQEGKFEAALTPLREHMQTQPDDVELSRLLAVALLGAGKMEAGTAMVRGMYVDDPRLADRAFDAKSQWIEERSLAEVFTRCVAYGNKTQSGAAWLSAAMIAQAQGRLALSRTMIDRAVKAGLQRDVGDAFAAAIDAAVLRAEREKRQGRDEASRKAALREAGRSGIVVGQSGQAKAPSAKPD